MVFTIPAFNQDENTLVYVAGNVCVLYDTEYKSQKFIPASDRTLAISGIRTESNYEYYSDNKQKLLAQGKPVLLGPPITVMEG